MFLTFKSLSKNGKNAFYTGAATPIRVPLNAFPHKQAPDRIEVRDGVFASVKAPKVKLSAEERTAQRANKPKLTFAEKIARREAALAKLKEQAKADGAHASM